MVASTAPVMPVVEMAEAGCWAAGWVGVTWALLWDASVRGAVGVLGCALGWVLGCETVVAGCDVAGWAAAVLFTVVVVFAAAGVLVARGSELPLLPPPQPARSSMMAALSCSLRVLIDMVCTCVPKGRCQQQPA